MGEKLYRVTATLKGGKEKHTTLLCAADTYDLVFTMYRHVINENVSSGGIQNRTCAFMDRVNMTGEASLTDDTSVALIKTFEHGEYDDD